MKTRFWRCAIISLLLGTLPAQWLAAATTPPCTGHAVGAVHKASERAAADLTKTMHRVAPEKASSANAWVGAHPPHHGTAHAHELLAEPQTVAHTVAQHVSQAVAGQDEAQAQEPTYALCASAGHCCLGAGLVSVLPLTDFAQRNVSADFAALTQKHRSPVLGGPERPPRFHSA